MKVIVNGILINATSIKPNEVLISKQEAKKLIGKHPDLNLFTRTTSGGELKLSRHKLEEFDTPGLINFFVRGWHIERVETLPDLKSLNADLDGRIIRAMRAELLRIGRTVYGQELQGNVRLTVGDRQIIIHSLWHSDCYVIDLKGVDGKTSYLASWKPAGTFEEKLGILRALKKLTRINRP